jgi:hypothetical protein
MAVYAGQVITAADAPAKPQYIVKASAENVTSSTTLQDDNDIVFSLDANKVYEVRLHASASGATAGDIKTAWAVTGGAAQLTLRECIGPGTAVTDVTASATIRVSRHSLTSSVSYGVDGTAVTSAIAERFLIETTTAGTAGTVKLQWAQNASSGTATTLSTSTYAVCEEVEAA